MALLKVMNVGQFPNVTQQTSPSNLPPTDCDKIPRDRVLDRYNCENEAFRRKFEPEPSRHGVTPPLPSTPNFAPRQFMPMESMPTMPTEPTGPYPVAESAPSGKFQIMYRPDQEAQAPPVEARLPSDMQYPTEGVLNKAYAAYEDARKGGDRDKIEAAFIDYRDAYDAYNKETPLANKLELIAYEVGHDSTSAFTGGAEGYRDRQKERIDMMEKLWPDWYKSRLEWGILSVTGGQPEWYLKLKEGAWTLVDLAMQIAPFLPYARGAAGAVRPFVLTPGRSMQFPMPGVVSPGIPKMRAPAPTSKTIWQRYNQQLQYPSGAPAVPSIDTSPMPSLPTMTAPTPVPVPTPGGQWWQQREIKAAPALPSKTLWQRYNQQLQFPSLAPAVPSIDTRSIPTSMQPQPMTVPQQAQPTSMAPQVETQSAGGGQCPPGQFPDGQGGCRSSVSSVPGIPGGIPTGGAPAGGIPFAMTGYYRVVNL